MKPLRATARLLYALASVAFWLALVPVLCVLVLPVMLTGAIAEAVDGRRAS